MLAAKLHNLFKRNEVKVINAQKVKMNSKGEDQQEEIDQDDDSNEDEDQINE